MNSILKFFFSALFLALLGGVSQAQATVFEDQFNNASWDGAKRNTYLSQ